MLKDESTFTSEVEVTEEVNVPTKSNKRDSEEAVYLNDQSEIQIDKSVSHDENKERQLFEANKVALQNRNLLEFSAIVSLGFLLSINAGFINGVTYSAVNGMPVSHLSGTSTQSGLALAKNDLATARTDMLLIFSFVCGSAISGFVLPGSAFRLTRGNMYTSLS